MTNNIIDMSSAVSGLPNPQNEHMNACLNSPRFIRMAKELLSDDLEAARQVAWNAQELVGQFYDAEVDRANQSGQAMSTLMPMTTIMFVFVTLCAESLTSTDDAKKFMIDSFVEMWPAAQEITNNMLEAQMRRNEQGGK